MERKQTQVLGNITGAIVVLGCLSIVSALVFLLCLQLSDLNKEPQTKALATISTMDMSKLEKEQRRETVLFALENDAQHLRTRRSQSLVGARLYIQSIALLAGISLLVMGSSFVFARIKSSPTEIGADSNNLGKLTIRAYSPGLILALYGTILIGYTLHISVQDGASIKTADASVFVLRDNGLPLFTDSVSEGAISHDDFKNAICRSAPESTYCKTKEQSK